MLLIELIVFMLNVRPLSCCGEISGNWVEVIYLLLAEGVDGEVDVDEEGHAHNYHKVQVENNLKSVVYLYAILGRAAGWAINAEEHIKPCNHKVEQKIT
jgi:hypothetical protein